MSDLTPEQIIEKARFNALTPAQKGLETKAAKAAKAEAEKVVSKPEIFINLLDADEAPEVKKAKEDEAPGVTDAFLNPFTEGVTYDEFLNAIPEGATVAEHLNGKLTESEIKWVCEEIEHFKKQKNN